MIVLSATTDKIQVILAATVATNQAQCIASWRDITATPSYVAGRSLANTNNTTDVDLIASPAASTQRVIDFISVFNSDTAPITITVKYDASGTDRTLYRGTLAVNEAVVFQNESGWQKVNANGNTVSSGTSGTNGTNGANGALTVSETELDFGAVPVREHVFTVIDAGVSVASRIIATHSGLAATDKQADENEMDMLVLNCVPLAGSFRVHAIAIPGPVVGRFKINYQFS